MPMGWIIYQQVMLADATTFLMYNRNIRQQTFDQLQGAEMVAFNRCKRDEKFEEWQQEGDTLIPYPDEPVEVMPGVTISKIALVRCLDAEAWVRAKYQIVVYDAQGRVMNLTDARLNEVFSVTRNDTDWTLDEDGWFYYNTPVASGAVTEPLFTEVVFDGPAMTNEFQNCTVNVNVHAQAVQTANNPDRAGWPEE